MLRDINDLQFENLELSKLENKNIAQKVINRIDNVKTIAGTQANMDNPYAANYPSLVSNEPLKDAQDYIMSFDGTVDIYKNPNTKNVVHILGGSIPTHSYLAYLFQTKFVNHIFGYTSVIFGMTVYLQNLEVYLAMQSYVSSVSLTYQICVTGGVNAPILQAYALEAKGATGYTLRNLSTYFDTQDQNTFTQHVKEKQILSNDRAVILVTQPQQLSIVMRPYQK